MWRKLTKADRVPGKVWRGRNRYEGEFDVTYLEGDGETMCGFVLANARHIYVLVEEVME